MEVFLDSYDVLKNPNTKFGRDQYQLTHNTVWRGKLCLLPELNETSSSALLKGSRYHHGCWVKELVYPHWFHRTNRKIYLNYF
jgi:hypothetical protein